MFVIHCTISASMCWESVIGITPSLVLLLSMQRHGWIFIQPKWVGSCRLYTLASCASHSFHTMANTWFGMLGGNGQDSLASNSISRIRPFSFGEPNYVVDGLQQHQANLALCRCD